MPHLGVETARDEAPAYILVVEDEPVIRFTIAEALRELGVSVVEAATADEAWQYLAAGGRVDLVFTDHRMPGSISGAELASRILREYPTLKVILTSAYLEKAEWRGPFLTKPYNLFKTAADLAEQATQKGQSEGGV